MRAYGKVRNGIRKAKGASGRIGSMLVVGGIALIIIGHVLGGSGVLPVVFAACGDAGTVVGLGLMLRQLAR